MSQKCLTDSGCTGRTSFRIARLPLWTTRTAGVVSQLGSGAIYRLALDRAMQASADKRAEGQLKQGIKQSDSIWNTAHWQAVRLVHLHTCSSKRLSQYSARRKRENYNAQVGNGGQSDSPQVGMQQWYHGIKWACVADGVSSRATHPPENSSRNSRTQQVKAITRICARRCAGRPYAKRQQ